jgi:hypothetical protein
LMRLRLGLAWGREDRREQGHHQAAVLQTAGSEDAVPPIATPIACDRVAGRGGWVERYESCRHLERHAWLEGGAARERTVDTEASVRV